MDLLYIKPHSKAAKILASLSIISASFLVAFSVLSVTHAQSTAPQKMLCLQIERYGDITDGSVAHPHYVTMTLTGSMNNQYIYSGFGKNGKDGGSGQSFNATYNVAAGKLLSASDGIQCPTILSQSPYPDAATLPTYDAPTYDLPTYQYPHTLPRTYDTN